MSDQICGFVGQALNGGRFISRGRGRHPERVIDSDELIYVVAGTLEMFEQEQVFTLHGGEWLILRRGRKHGGMRDYPSDLSFFWLHFRGEAGVLEQLPQHGRAARREVLTNYFQCFLTEQQAVGADEVTKDLLWQLIFRELQRSVSAGEGPGATPLALAAEKWLMLHFAEDASLRTMARALRCNPEYLGKLYRLRYGETVSQTVNRRRVEYAARLLTEGRLSIKEIGQLAGFNDPAYFRRQFFRRYAMSPGHFRTLAHHGHLNTE